jgi:hypothetical protein
MTLKHLGAAIDGPERIAQWIDSLLTDDGSYRDPKADAPLVFQTYWAVMALEALGVNPTDPERTERFILSLQLDNGFFRFDGIPEAASQRDAGSSGLCSAILRRIGRNSDPPAVAALERTAAAAESAIKSLLAGVGGDWRGLDGTDTDEFKGLVVLLADVSPGRYTEQERAAFAYCLEEIPGTRTDFFGPDCVNNMLDVAVAAQILAPGEIPGLAGLQEYLLEDIRPELEPLGGYGWGRGWEARVDPVMTWPTVQLFARAGLEYPYRDRLLEAVNTYRRSEGWVVYVLIAPDSGSTLDGLGMAQEIGWTGCDESKIKAYSVSILKDGDADCVDLRDAAKIAARAGMEPAELASLQRAALDRVCRRDPESQGRWLVPLFAEWGMAPPHKVADFLREQAAEDVRMLAVTLNMEILRDLILCQRVLGEEWLTVEDLTETIRSLKVEGGGYRLSPSSPGADLISTSWAVELLTLLGREKEIDVESCTALVLSCQRQFGFAFAPSGSVLTCSDPDFGSTGMALDTLRLLDSLREPASQGL